MSGIILGWVLTVIGVLAILAGVTGGVVKMIREIYSKGRPKNTTNIEGLTEFIKALTELLNSLIKAPIWLALIIIGFILIAWGGSFII
jgi:hypothetical protein